jgi:hypothetical protein
LLLHQNSTLQAGSAVCALLITLPHICPVTRVSLVTPQVGLEFHFAVEQRARSFLGQFFNFNGTAGVWRIAAINDAGGWESDTGECGGIRVWKDARVVEPGAMPCSQVACMQCA